MLTASRYDETVSLLRESSVARVVEWSDAALARLRDPWQELARRGACSEPFFQPEWFESFKTTLAPDAEALLLTTEDDGCLSGVMPLMRSKRFFRGLPAATLRSLSNLHSCRFDLIHDGRNPKRVAATMWKALKEQNDWEVIEALDVPPEANFEALLKCAVDDGYPIGRWPTRRMPYLPLSADPKNPFDNCPERFKGSRSRLKGKLNKLQREGKVEFALTTHADPDILRSFFALEASGWKGQNGSAIAGNPNLVAFYTNVARTAEMQGTLRMYSLLLDGRPIAMHFGLLMNGCYYIPKVAYHEGYKKVSPGLLLVKHVIEDLTAQRVRCFDFLGPRMEWKCVWSSHYREHADCYIFRRGVKGALLHALTMRIAPEVRKLKYRYRGDPQEV